MQVFIGPNGDEIHYQIFTEAAPSDVLSPNFRVMLDHQQQIIEEFFQAQRFGAEGMDEFMRRRLDEEKKLGNCISGGFPQSEIELEKSELRITGYERIQQIAYRKAIQIRKIAAACRNKTAH